MSKFLKTLLLFILPIAIILGPAFIVLLRSGELYPLTTIEGLSNSGPILYGEAYSNYEYQYKFDETRARRPKVLALGNSRVAEFEADFFENPSVFYNATIGGVDVLSSPAQLVADLADETPQIIIINMDQQLFTPSTSRDTIAEGPDPFLLHGSLYDPAVESMFLDGGWWRVYADYAMGKFTLGEVFGRHGTSTKVIGLRALATGHGYLSDGSDYWGDIIGHPVAQHLVASSIDTISASISMTNGDMYGTGISSDALTQLRDFLALCKQRNIFVIGFLPPVAHQEYERLKSFTDAAYHGSFIELGPTLAAIYNEYGFDFYDFSDISSFGGSDSEMVEAHHGGEKMYLRMFVQMAKGSRQLGGLVNIPYLSERLATSSPYIDLTKK